MEVNIIDLNKEKREPFVSSEMVGGISMGKLRKWIDDMYPLCKLPRLNYPKLLKKTYQNNNHKLAKM